MLFALLLILIRLVRAFGRRTSRLINRIMPPRMAAVVALVLVTLVTYGTFNRVVFDNVVEGLDASFMAINQEFSTDLPAPTSPNLSAGPDSSMKWKELGRQGRLFIHSAPSADDITAFAGKPGLQPVRAYVGVGTDGEIDLRQEAQLAVTELEQIGGFDRAVLNVATGTGRGWVNENQAQALELRGAETPPRSVCSIPTYQAGCPSWLTVTAPKRLAGCSSRPSMHTGWSSLRMPARNWWSAVRAWGPSGERRPSQELKTWLSAHRVHSSLDPLQTTPCGSSSQTSATKAPWRSPRSTKEARLSDSQMAAKTGLARATSGLSLESAICNIPMTPSPGGTLPWPFNKPDWLSEDRGRDVTPYMTWLPIVTMLQVGADQAMANSVPIGQGHLFGQAPVYAWAQIPPPTGWTDVDSVRLAPVIKERVDKLPS
ncbi:MAG: alpha/beta-hydrolase family protein [Marmoricola sp.]